SGQSWAQAARVGSSPRQKKQSQHAERSWNRRASSSSCSVSGNRIGLRRSVLRFGRLRLARLRVAGRLAITRLGAALEPVDRRRGLLLHALLEVLDLLGMPDRADVADQRVLAELHRG